MTALVQADIGYACFGVVIREGMVMHAAPIARWMVGKPARTCNAWVVLKGGTWTVVAEGAG
jgi:hypothetical protein